MSHHQIEHQHVVVLEQDIHKFYKQARFEKQSFDKAQWVQRFIETLPQWNALMLFRELEFDIWITTLVGCYHAAKTELDIPFLQHRNSHDIQRIMPVIVEKLYKVFTSVDFLEKIKAIDEAHTKQIRRYIEQFERITLHQHHLTTLKLYCAYQPYDIRDISICDLDDHLKTFEKAMDSMPLLKFGCLHRYRKVFRVPERKEYMCAYFFTFNRHLLDNTVPLFEELRRLWFNATYSLGFVYDLDLQDEDKIFEDNKDACDDLEYIMQQDCLNVADHTSRLRVWPKGFKQYQVKINRV